jgi:hypothetical protein
MIGIMVKAVIVSLLAAGMSCCSLAQQQESPLSILEHFEANRLAIRNYDVALTLRIDEFTKDNDNQTEKEMNQRVRCRIIVDWDSQKFFYVSENRISDTESSKKQYFATCFSDGRMTWQVDHSATPSMRKCDAARFLASIIVIDPTIATVDFGSGKTREQESEELLLGWQDSRGIRQPDGSLSAFLKFGNSENRFQSKVIFDPFSSMPVDAVVDRLNSKNGELLHNVVRSTPRYEKCKGVYRLASFSSIEKLLSDKASGVNPDVDLITNCEINWLKFNDEPFVFPENTIASFDLNVAKTLLVTSFPKD